MFDSFEQKRLRSKKRKKKNGKRKRKVRQFVKTLDIIESRKKVRDFENQKIVKSKDVKHECQFIRTMKIEEILVKSKDVKKR